MDYWTYVLVSEQNGTSYVGSTCKLDVRITLHNSGRCRYTKSYRPWRLMYSENFATRAEAMRRERFFKTGAGRAWLARKIDSLNNSRLRKSARV